MLGLAWSFIKLIITNWLIGKIYMRYSRHALGYWLGYLALLPLFPLIVWQGKQVKRNTVRLPEAGGERRLGKPGGIELLHLGESTVAGVGVPQIAQGLTGQLIHNLNKGEADYIARVVGKNGATITELNDWAGAFPEPDILLITMGVNDTTAFTPLKIWQSQLKTSIDKFSGENTEVLFTSVPAMHQFPALPKPLSWLLGLRSGQLNLSLKRLCEQNGWQLIHADLPINPQWMAEDGYHPNEQGYAQWAGLIAEKISDGF